MPELPEVETIRRGLERFCSGKKIVRVKVSCEKSWVGPRELAEGKTIEKFRRFGKALVLDLSEGVSLMIHLRMTGQLIWVPELSNILSEDGAHADGSVTDVLVRDGRFAGGHPSDSFTDALPNKQTRVEFELAEGEAGLKKARRDVDDSDEITGRLFFNDQRKFGFVKVIPTAEVEQDAFIRKLAPEPWQMEPQELYEKLQRHKGAPVKGVILDQTIIAGLGNIYADEALFYAGVRPDRKAGEVTREEAEQILLGAREVMTRSIESGGSTMATYVKADGTKGDYLRLFAQVFRREGEPCNKCGTEIVKTRVVGRGTHYCPRCQK